MNKNIIIAIIFIFFTLFSAFASAAVLIDSESNLATAPVGPGSIVRWSDQNLAVVAKGNDNNTVKLYISGDNGNSWTPAGFDLNTTALPLDSVKIGTDDTFSKIFVFMALSHRTGDGNLLYREASTDSNIFDSTSWTAPINAYSIQGTSVRTDAGFDVNSDNAVVTIVHQFTGPLLSTQVNNFARLVACDLDLNCGVAGNWYSVQIDSNFNHGDPSFAFDINQDLHIMRNKRTTLVILPSVTVSDINYTVYDASGNYSYQGDTSFDVPSTIYGQIGVTIGKTGEIRGTFRDPVADFNTIFVQCDDGLSCSNASNWSIDANIFTSESRNPQTMFNIYRDGLLTDLNGDDFAVMGRCATSTCSASLQYPGYRKRHDANNHWTNFVSVDDNLASAGVPYTTMKRLNSFNRLDIIYHDSNAGTSGRLYYAKTTVGSLRPDVNVFAPEGQLLNGRNNTFTIDFNASDPDNEDLNVRIAYSSEFNSGAFTTNIVTNDNLTTPTDSNLSCTKASGDNTFACNYTWGYRGVTDGNYFIDINVFDATLLSGSESSNPSFMIDANVPLITFVSPTNGSSNLSSKTVIFDLNDSNSGINDANVTINTVASTSFSFPGSCTDNGNHYRCSYTESKIGNGSNTLRIDTNDAANNIATGSITFTFGPDEGGGGGGGPPTPTCSNAGGFICEPPKECSGSWLDASNTDYCCSVQCTEPKDLIANSFTAAPAGSIVNLLGVVFNDSSFDSGSFTTQIRRDSTTGPLIKSETFSLEPDEERNVVATDLPGDGTFTYYFIVDSSDIIEESDETNNQLSETITIGESDSNAGPPGSGGAGGGGAGGGGGGGGGSGAIVSEIFIKVQFETTWLNARQIVTVESQDGKPVVGSSVKTDFPSGKFKLFFTKEDGQVSFIVDELGVYNVKATRGDLTAEDKFIVVNVFEFFQGSVIEIAKVLFGETALDEIQLFLFLIIIELVLAFIAYRLSRNWFGKEIVSTTTERKRKLLRILFALILVVIPMIVSRFMGNTFIAIVVGIFEIALMLLVNYIIVKRRERIKAIQV